MEIKTSFKKYLAFCGLGFALGGVLWGVILYWLLPQNYPFHWLTAIITAIFGGVLAWPNGKPKILKAVVVSIIGFFIGLLTANIFIFDFYLFGSFLFMALYFLSFCLLLKNGRSDIDYFFDFEKINMGLGSFWLAFLVAGIIIAFFYAIFLKRKIWPMVWRGAVGFALGSFVGPLIGNILGRAFDSLLLTFILSFSLMSLVFGLFLAWGMYYFPKGEVKKE